MLGISQGELARLSRVSEATIADFERGVRANPQPRTLHDLRTALEAQGIQFIWTDSGTGIVAQH